MDRSSGEQRSAQPTGPQRLRQSWPYWIALLIALAALRVFLTTTIFPQTFDEGIHILCGLEWLDHGTYTIEEQHPPLARIAAAIGPYLAGLRLPAGADPSSMWKVAGRVLPEPGDYLHMLMLARLGILPFFIALCFLLAVWTKRWFGVVGAIIATVLLTTTPPVLAHAGLATTDMAAAATVFFALGSFFALLERPSWKTALTASVCTALALLAKFSSIPFLAVCLPVLLFFRWLLGPPLPWRSGIDWRRASQLAVVFVAVCGLIVWAGLRFSIGPLFPQSDRPHQTFSVVSRSFGISADRMNAIFEAPVYPAAEIVRGVLEVNDHNHAGHLAYLLGQVHMHGLWYYFPVVFAVKTPIPFLLLGLVSLGLIFINGFRRRDWRLPALAGCALAIMAVSMSANLNLGVRHILILYPLLALAAGSLGSAVRQSKAAAAVIIFLVGWQTVDSSRAHPDYLPYFNQLAGDHPEDILVGSDLDWGQDLLRLSHTVRELKIDKLTLRYSGSAIPGDFDFPELHDLEEGQHPSGWVAISLTQLKLYPDRYGWLERYEPYALVGKSIRLYRLPEAAP